MELCEEMVEVRRVSDRVLTNFVVFEEDALRLICVYSPQVEGVREEVMESCVSV